MKYSEVLKEALVKATKTNNYMLIGRLSDILERIQKQIMKDFEVK